MNQRKGSYHAAAMNDEGGGNITLKQLIAVIRAAQHELETNDEEDSALRFEIFGDFLENDIANGKPFSYTSRMIGL